MTQFDRAFTPIQQAIDTARIPGAVLGLLEHGKTTLRATGHATITPTRTPMRVDTIFDLASLTKVVFTTTAILRLAEQGRLDLDAPLTTAIPDLRQYDVANAPERKLTFRQCLAHATHLPAVEPLYTYGQDPQTLRAFILQREWRSLPPAYSDINFLLLGIAIERLTNPPLIDQPLRDYGLPPGLTFRPIPADTAATEHCTWRNRILQGEVHDENAFAMGGAAGHAGLFGTAAALLAFAQSLLDGTLLAPASLTAITTQHHTIQGVRRALGWQLATPGWPGGDACPPTTIGHTGFTGTGLWIDLQNRRAWTLLTNRVHPSRHTDSGIAPLRQQVGTALTT